MGRSLLPDGMAALWSVHTAADVDAIMTALQTVADRDRGDGRLVGERRADALRDLILGRTTPAPAPRPVKHRPITIADAFRYEPCPALRDKIIQRDQTCRFPGCNRAAVTCEIDHSSRTTDTTPSNTTCKRCVPATTISSTKAIGRSAASTTAPPNGPAPTGRTYVKPPPEPDDHDPP